MTDPLNDETDPVIIEVYARMDESIYTFSEDDRAILTRAGCTIYRRSDGRSEVIARSMRWLKSTKNDGKSKPSAGFICRRSPMSSYDHTTLRALQNGGCGTG